MRSQGWLIAIISLTVWGLAPSLAWAQTDRARLEAEARGQATEADQRFKEKDYEGALILYQAERASRAVLGDLRYEAYAARACGCCLAELGQYDAAVEAWNDARRLDAKREDAGFEGYDSLLIGNMCVGIGRLREAEEALEQALRRLSKAGDREHEAEARRLLGRVLTLTGRADESEAHFERAWELATALHDEKRLGDIGADWGLAALAFEAPGRAFELWDDARRAFEACNVPGAVALIERQLGDALIALGLPEAAAAHVEQAVAGHERLGDLLKLADDLNFLAELKAAANAFPEAVALARRAASACHDADDAEAEREALVVVAQFQSLAGDWKQSAATLDGALTLVRRDGEAADRVRLLILAADVERRAGAVDRERALFDEADRTASAAKDDALVEAVARARLGAAGVKPKR